MKNEKGEGVKSVVVLPPDANLQLPDYFLLLHYKDLSNRIFWIDGEIDESYLALVKQIFYWNREDEFLGLKKEDRTPIKILISSPGGDLDVFRSIKDMIEMSETPVYGYAMGPCYSAAAMVFLSCDKRFMSKSSSLLLHKGSGNVAGTYQEIEMSFEEYKKQVKELSELICARSNYSIQEVEEQIVKEWYVSPQQALEKGMCHKILESVKEIF